MRFERKDRSMHVRSLELLLVFCRLIDAGGNAGGIREEFVGVEAGTYDADARWGTWESKRRCGCIKGTGVQARSLGSKMGLFFSDRLEAFKFESCRLKAPEWSKSLFDLSFSVCIRLREVDSRLSVGFVVLYRSSTPGVACSLLLRPNILASIMQEGLRAFQENNGGGSQQRVLIKKKL